MVSKLEEGLRSICCQYGWSYGIYWRIDGGDSGLLTVGGAYYEERLGKMLNDMLRQIHRVGDGVVGGAALTGRRHWVFSDSYFNEHNLNTSTDNGMLQGNAALYLQFLAGIETIAILPLQPLGVFQFGSSQKIVENLGFFNQVKDMVQKTEIMSELCMHGVSQGTGDTHDPCGFFSSAVSTRDSYFGYKNMNPIYNNSFNDTIPVKQYSTASAISSESAFALTNSLHANIISMPAQKASPFTSSSCLSKSHEAASIGDQFLMSSNTGLHQDFARTAAYSPFTALANNHRSNASNDEILALMEQQLLKMIGTQEFPATPEPVVPHENLAHHLCGDSSITSFENINGLQDAMPSGGSLNIPLSLPACSVSDSYQSCSKLLSQGPSVSVEAKVEPVSFLTFSEDLATECATSILTKSNAKNDLIQLDHTLKHEIDISTVPRNESLLGSTSVTSGFGSSGELGNINISRFPNRPAEILSTCLRNSPDAGSCVKENHSGAAASLLPDQELFDGMELDLKNCSQGHSYWEDILIPEENANCTNLGTNLLECISGLDIGLMGEPEKDLFSDFGLHQLFGCVSAGNTNSSNSHSSASNINSTIINHNSRNQYSSTTNVGNIPLYSNQVPSAVRTGRNAPLLSECNLDNIMQASSSDSILKSQVSSWIDDCYSMNAANAVTASSKKPEEHSKVPRKRARPGESTRPRPKDRQLIQDRVKELREIVPNGSKCSIDALLDHTIKHMLYLQNVTKYSEKLKQADESKMIGEENGVILRDNTNGGSGGATWAFEVAGQTMVCPIIVEDLSPPGQMLVEMLCEERGYFLEIADIIRGFGLTILKGVMEIRDSKIWARFLVEANREVTRMEIFLSLVQLLQQTTSNSGPTTQPTKTEMDTVVPRFDHYKQSPHRIPISLPDRLQ